MRIHRRRTASVLALVVALLAAPAFADASSAGVVNVNTATAEQLELLPGVGPALAGRILEHREANGAFKKVDDLLLVRGIGEKSLERIRPYVATSGATTLKERVPSPRTKKSEK